MRRTYFILRTFGLIFSLASCGFAGQAAPTQADQEKRQGGRLTPTRLAPSEEPAPAATPAPAPPSVPPAEGTITIEAPAAGASITSPVRVTGSTDFWPFEATLSVDVKDANGNLLGWGYATVQAPAIGQGGPFEGTVAFTPPVTDQAGTLEVAARSPKDGSRMVLEAVAVRLSPQVR
jgi:hypothetical protein